MSAAVKATRETKTPRQRAQEALDSKDRKIKRIKKRIDKTHGALDDLQRELHLAERRRAYLAASPDLDDPDQLVIPAEQGGDS